MKTIFAVIVTLLVLFQVAHTMGVHSVFHLHASAATEHCADDACEPSLQCAALCLSAVQQSDFTPIVAVLLFSIIVTVSAWTLSVVIGKKIQTLLLYHYSPHYLFNTVILRE